MAVDFSDLIILCCNIYIYLFICCLCLIMFSFYLIEAGFPREEAADVIC
jgi:hypothetical protein